MPDNTLHGCPVQDSLGDTVVHCDRSRYFELLGALKDDGYELPVGLTGVDYLTHPGRDLPSPIAPERFEVVVELLSLQHRRRIRVRCQVPGGDPRVHSLFELWPGMEAHERETYDLYGIVFEDHPDLARILMPEDWEGHPLRKDYDVGHVPVQFKEVPTWSVPTTQQSLLDRILRRGAHEDPQLEELLEAKTDEGAQEMAPRARTGAAELGREEGQLVREGGQSSQLRLAEGMTLDSLDLDVETPEDETMILNLGPSHPSTHGVLRVMVELDGETILRAKPVVGYLHTGMEKTAEELMYHQGCTNVTRMDYLSPFFNELAFCLSTEKLLGIEVPERATWIRMLMCELNRISSHFLWLATNGSDIGAINMLVYGWRDREMVLAFFEKVTGLRMNHNYFRPGGVAAELPDGWKDDVVALCEAVLRRMDEYDRLLTGQPILQRRLQGVGPIDAEAAIGLGLTGPILRSTGVPWDLRRDQPYLAYDEVDFDVMIGTAGDCWDRYVIRINEVRESARIARQIVDMMPSGDYRSQDKKVTPPPRNRIDESMEALIHHFKLYTEGFRVPPGETYVPIETPRGEAGCYIVSDGTARPYRVHMRAASFANLQGLATMARGALIADTVAIVSTIDPLLGDVDR